MKLIYSIGCFVLACLFMQDASAQEPEQRRTPRQRNAEASNSGLPALTARAASKNEDQKRDIENAAWLREIYRFVDLTKENNAALYYPTQPIGDRMNLFTLLFKLVSEGKVTSYKYLGDREIFTDQYKESPENILKYMRVSYQTEGTGNNQKFVFDENDIPSNEVTIYMIKEAYYFDQSTGTFNTKVLAISPMLVSQMDDYGNPERIPLFWVTYESIRPYISNTKIMTSNVNNAMTYTMDDYFNKQMYSGEIVKTTNMMNQSLAQQVKSEDPEVLKQAQDSIEGQLKIFEESLWIPKDTTAVADKKGKAVKSSGAKTTSSSSKESKPKESKPKEQKQSSPSSATKSVRRTR